MGDRHLGPRSLDLRAVRLARRFQHLGLALAPWIVGALLGDWFASNWRTTLVTATRDHGANFADLVMGILAFGQYALGALVGVALTLLRTRGRTVARTSGDAQPGDTTP